MHDPLSDLNAVQAQQLAQMQEPQRMFPLVNPRNGITMTSDSGIDDTGHLLRPVANLRSAFLQL